METLPKYLPYLVLVDHHEHRYEHYHCHYHDIIKSNRSEIVRMEWNTLAESRIATRTRARGWEGSDNELGLVTGLLSRLAHLGDGAQAAAVRRQQAGREEKGRRRDQMAHYLAHIRGRGVNRAGEVFVHLGEYLTINFPPLSLSNILK